MGIESSSGKTTILNTILWSKERPKNGDWKQSHQYVKVISPLHQEAKKDPRMGIERLHLPHNSEHPLASEAKKDPRMGIESNGIEFGKDKYDRFARSKERPKNGDWKNYKIREMEIWKYIEAKKDPRMGIESWANKQ